MHFHPPLDFKAMVIFSFFFFCRNNTDTVADIKEAMQASLIFSVKTPSGKNFEDFRTQVKLKTSQSPFNSSKYNESASAWFAIVSI